MRPGCLDRPGQAGVCHGWRGRGLAESGRRGTVPLHQPLQGIVIINLSKVKVKWRGLAESGRRGTVEMHQPLQGK